MKAKVSVVLSTAAVLPLALGGLFLTGGCTPEEPPMPAGVYVPPPSATKLGPSNHNNPLMIQNPGTKVGPSNHNNPLMVPNKEKDKDVVDTTTAPVAPKTELEDFKEPVQPAIEKKEPVMTGESTKYTVVRGDSLWKVAKMHGISVAELAAYNNIAPTSGIKIGQKLLIPPGAKAVAVPVKADHKPMKKAAAPAAKKAPTAKKAAPTAKKAEKAAAATDGIYVVKSGDSYSKIAAKLHMKIADLEAANPGVSSSRLQVGQKLNVKPGAGATAPAAAAATKAGGNAEKTAAGKPAAEKTEDMLLEDIPNPDAPAKTADSKDVNPVATTDAVKTVTEGAPAASSDDKVVNSADGSSVKVGADTTVEAIAKKYGHQVDELKIMNPALPADGKVKAGTVVLLP